MKIITTTYEDFINSEIADHGHDYVEAQFLLGYEPLRQNSVWIWGKNVTTQLLRSIHAPSNSSSSSVFCDSNNMGDNQQRVVNDLDNLTAWITVNDVDNG
jgi:hypothetical protein